MREIKIKNFGPIVDGYSQNGGFLPVSRVTVFIGDQGSGKSTVTKLISTCSWIEKAFFQGRLPKEQVVQHNRFKKLHCAYQGIENYFMPETEIEYKGDFCTIKYDRGNTSIELRDDSRLEMYQVPKIMYTPAERNFLSVIARPDRIKDLPKPLNTFLEEYLRSLEELSGRIELPINDLKFEFQKQHKISYIVGQNYRIRLSEASSGLQSVIPLVLVARNLAEYIGKPIEELSADDKRKLKEEINRIITNPNITGAVKESTLELMSRRFRASYFMNIVEEIEQNLFPSSQRNVLNELLAFTTKTNFNELILTTHSPYIVNFLTLAIKANEVKEKIEKLGEEKSRLLLESVNNIVPISSCIPSKQVAVYEMTREGSISELPKIDGLISDSNYLNTFLAETNSLFDKLLDIEDEL